MSAQTPVRTPPTKDDEIVRVRTDLIQIGISVVDKNGAFVRDLKKDDLQLRVDGKLVTPDFFEQVSIRTRSEATKGEATPGVTTNIGVSTPPALGRTIAFVVDDLNLGPESSVRTKNVILKFIESQMLPGDRVAIVSSAGRIGFLQQYTTDKVVLRAAANRLAYSRISSDDRTPPPMTAFEALAIDRLDREVTDAFIDELLRTQRGLHPGMAETTITSRAKAILKMANQLANRTLSVLHTTTSHAALFNGRKVIYFISDGFLLDSANTDSAQNLNRITDAAARSNTVIYSIDAKGLDGSMPEGSLVEAANRRSGRRGVTTPASPGTAFRIQAGSSFESQDGLAYMAHNTGGKFIRNTNDLEGSVKKIADEAFTYYLLAWDPLSDSENPTKLRRIEVSVKDRPDLIVHAHGGYLEKPRVNGNDRSETDPEQRLVTAAMSQAPQSELRTDISVRYGDGSLFAKVMVDADTVEFVPSNDVASAKLEILVLIYDAEGKQQRAFRTPLEVGVPAARLGEIAGRKFGSDYEAALKPGLYQVRVAVRDKKTGKIGTASRWIEIAAR